MKFENRAMVTDSFTSCLYWFVRCFLLAAIIFSSSLLFFSLKCSVETRILIPDINRGCPLVIKPEKAKCREDHRMETVRLNWCVVKL